MSYIICKDLSFSYDNQIVVSGLNFQVDEGDYPVSYTHLDVYKRQRWMRTAPCL